MGVFVCPDFFLEVEGRTRLKLGGRVELLQVGFME